MADDERIFRQVGFRAQAGRGDELARRLTEAATALEPVAACELYLVARVPGEPDTVWVHEVWSSREAADGAVDPGSAEVQAVLALIDGAPEVFETVSEGGLGPRGSQAPAERRGHTLINLLEAEDLAPRHGLEAMGETRVPRAALGAERTGIAHYRQRPGRQPFGHRHEAAEEIYVVLGGSGRVKLDDEVVDLRPLDALRVAPGTTRQFEAGPEGMEYLAFGPHLAGESEILPGWWDDGTG